jgi:hypothetical protein
LSKIFPSATWAAGSRKHFKPKSELYRILFAFVKRNRAVVGSSCAPMLLFFSGRFKVHHEVAPEDFEMDDDDESEEGSLS